MVMLVVLVVVVVVGLAECEPLGEHPATSIEPSAANEIATTIPRPARADPEPPIS
jgi:hypothetical protein